MKSVNELMNEAFEREDTREREKLSGFKEIEGGERTGMIDNYGWDFFNRYVDACYCTNITPECVTIRDYKLDNNISQVTFVEENKRLKRSDLKLSFKRDVFRFIPTISSKDRLKLKF